MFLTALVAVGMTGFAAAAVARRAWPAAQLSAFFAIAFWALTYLQGLMT
jgi:hypothetical protein